MSGIYAYFGSAQNLEYRIQMHKAINKKRKEHIVHLVNIRSMKDILMEMREALKC